MGRIFESKIQIQILDFGFDFLIHFWGEDFDFDPKINNKTALNSYFFKCFIRRIVIYKDETMDTILKKGPS